MSYHYIGVLIGFFVIALVLNLILLSEPYTDYTMSIRDGSGNELTKSIFTLPSAKPALAPEQQAAVQQAVTAQLAAQQAAATAAAQAAAAKPSTKDVDLKDALDSLISGKKADTATEPTGVLKDVTGKTKDLAAYVQEKVDKEVKKTLKDAQSESAFGYKMDGSQQKCGGNGSTTPALAQGSEFTGADGSPYGQGQQSCKKSEPEPCPYDMNEYIKKDKIPCWGCSLK